MTSTITDAQIRTLRTEAATADDYQTVRDCDAALAGDFTARESVAGDIAVAAMDDGDDAEDAYWYARDNERRAAGF